MKFSNPPETESEFEPEPEFEPESEFESVSVHCLAQATGASRTSKQALAAS
jgi:hypothetical protein